MTTNLEKSKIIPSILFAECAKSTLRELTILDPNLPTEKKNLVLEHIDSNLSNLEIMSLVFRGTIPKYEPGEEKQIYQEIKQTIKDNFKLLTEMFGYSTTVTILTETEEIPNLLTGSQIEKEYLFAKQVFSHFKKNAPKMLNTAMTSSKEFVSKVKSSKYLIWSVAAFLAIGSFTVVNAYLTAWNKKAKMCEQYIGTERELCIQKVKVELTKKKISDYKDILTGCTKTDNPDICKKDYLAKISTEEKRLNVLQDELSKSKKG